MIAKPAKSFTRIFRGYDPALVDPYIEALLAKEKVLIDEVLNLRTQRDESSNEAAGLRIEVACLKDEVAALSDTSPTPNAMQHRMAKLLRRTLDEVSRMQDEARAEADALIADAVAEGEAARREHRELLEHMAVQRKALEMECEETRKKLDADLARMRAEAQALIDAASRDAQHEREQLLADAKQKAHEFDERAHRAMDEANQQRIMILEELMGVARDLEGVPTSLESAYQQRQSLPEADVVVALDQKKQAPGNSAVAS